MTPDNRIRDERPEREMSEQDDPTLTTRVSRPGSTEEEATPVETKPAEAPEASGGIVQQIWRRIKEERNRPKRVEINTRGQNNMDRSKAFLGSRNGRRAVRLRVSRLVLHLQRGKAGAGPADEAQFGETGRRSATGGASRIHDPASQCRPRRR